MSKKISVVVPVYNVEKYLDKCLDSIVNQTYKNLEIICVNDGSTDNSINILESYREKDDRFIIINKKNSGVSQSRNMALDIATGEYIMFVDGDDWIDFDVCETAIKYIIEEDTDVVFWNYIREFGDKSLIKNIYSESIIKFNTDEVKNKLHRRFFGLYKEELANPENANVIVTVWGKLYKASTIKKANAKFKDIALIGSCEDGLFNIEVFIQVKSALFINKPMYHYRKTNCSSQTTTYNPNLFEQWNNLYYEMNNFILNNSLGEEYTVALQNRIALSVMLLCFNLIGSKLKFSERICKLKKYIDDEQYSNAIESLELQYFNVPWKLYFWLLKKHKAFCVYFYSVIINKLRG